MIKCSSRENEKTPGNLAVAPSSIVHHYSLAIVQYSSMSGHKDVFNKGYAITLTASSLI